ncbi:hypothetical protein EVAR_67721_1 [Eumeta japonica]|uniref:Uncharacterized protein n=1 Tax=Eumeta variegata TaxID=151549 RepID=A0A4C1ZFB3_EUMVA|nr:hypothetical protein EVAR_67721_1 [Eumeta japonica]
MRKFNAPRPFLAPPRTTILRHCDAFAANFTVAEFRDSYTCKSVLTEPRNTQRIRQKTDSRVEHSKRATSGSLLAGFPVTRRTDCTNARGVTRYITPRNAEYRSKNRTLRNSASQRFGSRESGLAINIMKFN